MTVQAHIDDRRLVVLAVLGVVLALTAAMWTLAGCAPKAEPSAPAASEQKDGNGGLRHGRPAGELDDGLRLLDVPHRRGRVGDRRACPQASAHEAEGVTCVQCHTDEAVLSTEHADVKFGDKAATKATVVTVDPETCISCHGTMEEMARQDRGLHGAHRRQGHDGEPPRRPLRTRSTTPTRRRARAATTTTRRTRPRTR